MKPPKAYFEAAFTALNEINLRISPEHVCFVPQDLDKKLN